MLVSRSRSTRLGILGVAAIAAVVATGLIIARPWQSQPSCPPAAEHPEWTVARRWDEAILGAIRRALPAPTVHARNLYHTSAGMWDAWAAYDAAASGVFVKEKLTSPNVTAARNEAISYAAYRILSSRYIKSSVGTSRCRPSPTSWTRSAIRWT